MKKSNLLFLAAGAALFGFGIAAQSAHAADVWYDVTFTGADIWTYSADNVAQARTDQTAPRRYRDWTQTNAVQSTTYGVNNQGSAAVNFNTWAPTSGFAFDELNLWGAGGATAWGEKYISVGTSDVGAEGVSSWQVIQSPTGWTSGIVKGNDPWSADSTHAFPVWRSGTGATLGLSNMNDADFAFHFQVLISNPLTAFEPDGKLRVYFGGFSDDLQGTGLDNYEVSGVMLLTATPSVPEPASLSLLALGGIALLAKRRRKA